MMRRRLAASGLFLAAGWAVPGVALASEGNLEIFPDWTGQLPVLIVLFLLLIIPCQKLLFAPLLRVLDERRARIEGRKAKAQELEAETGQVLERYEAAVGEARQRAQEDRRALLDQARRSQAEITNAARAAAERELSGARAEVARALDQAREEVRRRAEGLAREAAAQVLGRPLS